MNTYLVQDIHPPRRRAFTKTELVVVLGILILFSAVALLSLPRHREFVRRDVCRQNLNTIATALYVYANDNRSMFPIAAHPDPIDDRTGAVDYTQAIGSYRGRTGEPEAGNTALMWPRPTKLSTTRNLWTLFRCGFIERERFVCPSTQDQPNTEPNASDYWDFGSGDLTGPATPEQARQGWSQVSYGYQVPYGKHGQPTADVDKNMVVADKGPFGAAIDGGYPAPPPISVGEMSPPEEWRPWNSPNHGGPLNGEGQNALYGGGWTEFFPKPTASWGMDNIYTQWQESPRVLLNRVRGIPPTCGGKQTPLPAVNITACYPESLIYP